LLASIIKKVVKWNTSAGLLLARLFHALYTLSKLAENCFKADDGGVLR